MFRAPKVQYRRCSPSLPAVNEEQSPDRADPIMVWQWPTEPGKGSCSQSSSPSGAARSASGCVTLLLLSIIDTLNKCPFFWLRNGYGSRNWGWKCFCVKMCMVWKESQFSDVSRNAIVNCTWGKLQIYSWFYRRGYNCKSEVAWGQGGVCETKLNGSGNCSIRGCVKNESCCCRGLFLSHLMFVEQLSRSHVNLPFIKHRNSCMWICYLREAALTPGCHFVLSSCQALQFCFFPVRLFHGLKYPVFQKTFINNLFPNQHFAHLWIQHCVFGDSLSACTLQGLWDF